MNRTIRLALIQCAAFALSSVVLSANANEYYNQDKITEDLHTACKDFSIASDGVFKALCIKSTPLTPSSPSGAARTPITSRAVLSTRGRAS